ncbi:hypothetical protein BDF14DRAFT_480239 [Spinellus fusiger]|nr:hypothetical protein BDF14DRAFT_480239 [Spinellus fusiger]
MNYNYFTAPGHEVVCPDLSVFRELQTTQPQQQDSHVPLVPTPSVRARTARNKVSKRKQVKNACVNCQKACKKCDEGRPCRRCIKLGLTETCINSPRKERRKGVKRGPYKKRRHHQAVVILPTNDRQIKEIPIASISPNAPVPGLKPSLEYLGVRAASLLPQEPWCEPSYTVPQQETLSTLLSIDQIDSDSKDLQFNNNVVFTASSSTPSLSLSPLSWTIYIRQPHLSLCPP